MKQVIMKAISVFLIFFMSDSVYASEIKTLRCIFDKGGFSAQWDLDGKFKSEEAEFSSNELETVGIFDQIDFQNNKARFIGNLGAVDVLILPSHEIITFFHILGRGNRIFTSVFINSPSKDGSFPFVMSRHLDMVMSPTVSQYYGTCIKLF